MVKLLVKKDFMRVSGLVKEGETIEVSEEIAKKIEELVPDRVERVKEEAPKKSTPRRKKQTPKQAPKNEDDE